MNSHISNGRALTLIDLSVYRGGNTGVDYVHRIDSGVPGPVALITALVHGNELCGAHALDFLLREQIRPARGTMILCFANVECYLRFDRLDPYSNRFVDRDMNRVWQNDILENDHDSYEARRARELLPFIDEADFLLDLHTMRTDCRPIVLAGMTQRSVDLSEAMGVPSTIVLDAGHGIGTRLRDYGSFSDSKCGKTALLIECGQHLDPASADVAIICCLRFLAILDMLDGADNWQRPDPQRTPKLKIEVTEAVQVQSNAFQFVEEFQGLEVISKKHTVIAYDDGNPVRTPYDNTVIIIPSKRLQRGLTAVRFGKIV